MRQKWRQREGKKEGVGRGWGGGRKISSGSGCNDRHRYLLADVENEMEVDGV